MHRCLEFQFLELRWLKKSRQEGPALLTRGTVVTEMGSVWAFAFEACV